MKYYKIVFLCAVLLFYSCSVMEVEKESDIVVVSANILIDNEKTASEITSSLIGQDADVYLLHEAVVGINVDKELFLEKGYTVFSHNMSIQSVYNGVIASRINGEYGSPDLFYYIGSGYSIDSVKVAPFFALHLEIDSIPISIIGAHIPHGITTSSELRELRSNAFNDIGSLINNGRIIMNNSVLKIGDNVILGGDLNSFPNEPLLNHILDSGMEDSFLTNSDKYDFTWSPAPLGISVARIDYVFHSEQFSANYQESIDVPGSDHKGLIVGVKVK